MVAVGSQFVTEEEYLSWPPGHERRELLDGEVLVSPSCSFQHQQVVRRLALRLQAWCETHPPHQLAFAPLDIRFGPGRILQPDLVVLPHTLPDHTPTPITLLPALCVEVLSADVRYDRHTKRLVYAEAGLAEYWVVDPMAGVEVFTGQGLRARRLVTDRLVSATLPELEIDLAGLRPGT
ncbi:MAG: Uma2 family endonuclease [Alphaproteobacteria bacterium]|nr:Uma2 family endonuclease [Alphaproteobacteria bacterium]